MCDYPVVRSALRHDSILKCSHSGARNRHLETQLAVVDELRADNSLLEVRNYGEAASSPELCGESHGSYPYRFRLEQDVQRLQQQLQKEIELHSILENAIEKNAAQELELLSNIAVLEVSVLKLEQEMISLHFQLSQERNERRLAEYHLKHLSTQSISTCSSSITETQTSSSLRCLKNSNSELRYSSESESTGESSCTKLPMEDAMDSPGLFRDKNIFTKMDTDSAQPVEFRTLFKGMPLKGLWDHPNLLSEEMVRCMKNIFMSLADSAIPSKSSASDTPCSTMSPRGHLSSSSWWSSSERSMISSWVQSPRVDIERNSEVLASENTFDPYRVSGKLSWADIGKYALATEISWMSVGKEQLEYASGALRRFRTLVGQLARVNHTRLSCYEKLAFWINLYNALIMHAYLAYGVPKSDLKLFSLMQKAAYTVGGHSFSAAAIEYVILKMKPPLHRPQIALLLALHKLKVSEEQRKSVIDSYEPLVAFALSCGMYSSPAVRIYTAEKVEEELQEAQHDFIRASVGISSKGKLLVPKMLHCFAKSYVDDSNLAVWISHYLPPHQAAFVEQCISQRRQSLLGSRNCGILSFDSRFRYLFLPGKITLK
ncbi:uncharacterized protein LOC120007990 isoform X2 [Tripterygium wilfordii]|uniref:uncharacterized protein LOC120007990 isoform X2 n=1 Tax=Tripterygium wilfordii TaxID=458696 RepID=UPI0018F80403|nr:uncharacterized protein LOC120007990 isoform X2 [Tripterygium wilfordii]